MPTYKVSLKPTYLKANFGARKLSFKPQFLKGARLSQANQQYKTSFTVARSTGLATSVMKSPIYLKGSPKLIGLFPASITYLSSGLQLMGGVTYPKSIGSGNTNTASTKNIIGQLY